MKRYLVSVTLEATVEAESEHEAIENAPALPVIEGWYAANTDPYTVEEA